MDVKAVFPRCLRVPGDRVRVASENPLRCNADLRPVEAAGRLILISEHIDTFVAVVPCGPLDARALAVERMAGRAWPLGQAGDADASGWTLSPGRLASSVCCVLLGSRTKPPSTRPLKHRYRNDGWGRRAADARDIEAIAFGKTLVISGRARDRGRGMRSRDVVGAHDGDVARVVAGRAAA